ncbi:hypothetical protein PM082_023208 [Marasmius tenuissimus]|nr:hypothetical protein PM082_023208 [Marasmius tenuissimus]
MGMIQITSTKEIFNPVKDLPAARAWEEIIEQFSKPTLSAIYGDFVKLVSFRLTTSNPQVGVVLPELIKALLLIAIIPPEWDTASSKSLHNDPMDKAALTVSKVQEAIMVECERHNPQLTNRLSRAGNHEPSFGQQQCQQQNRTQCGNQQQQNQQRPPQQQQRPSSSRDKGRKKKQQRGTRDGINQYQGSGNAGSNNSSNNRSHGHSHLTSYASVVAAPPPTCPYSLITDRRECIVLNMVNNSLCAEIASAPPRRARGSPPPAHFTGHWDRSCDSTAPPPVVNRNPAAMQSFTGFRHTESVFDDVQEAHTLADRLGAPKTAQYLKPLEQIVTSATNCLLQECIQLHVSSSKCLLEDDEGHEGARYDSPTSSKCACSIESDEDVEIDWSDDSMDDMTSLFGNDIDNDIAEAAGVEDVPDDVSLGLFHDNRQVLFLDLLSQTDMTLQ